MVEAGNNYQNFHFVKMLEIGSEYFNFKQKEELNPLATVKSNAKFNTFKLTDKFSEQFIRISSAPVFWINETRFIKDVELYNSRYTKTNIDHFLLVKEYFTKWIINKNRDEKKQIASATARQIEKYPKEVSFLLKLYLATLLTFEESLFNKEKAVILFEEILDFINMESSKADFFKELQYLVNLYYAFLHLRCRDWIEAKGKLYDAMSIKTDGINAHVYFKIVEMILGNSSSIKSSLNEIADLDMGRLQKAINTNNFNAYEYFIINNIVSIIFNFQELSEIYEDFDQFFEDTITSNQNTLSELQENAKRLKTYPDSNHIKKENLDNILFVERIIDKYLTSNNFILLRSCRMVENHYNKTIKEIEENIRKSFIEVVEKKVKAYQISISEQQSNVNEIVKEEENLQKTLQKEEEKAVKEFEEKAESEVERFDNKINNLTKNDELNPKVSFQNTFVYGIIIALLVSVLGGFAGYSNSFSANINDIGHVMSSVVLKGLQWGLVTIIIAFIVAILASGAVVLEKSKQKMKYLKKISDIKRFKDVEIQKIKNAFSKKAKNIKAAFQERIDEENVLLAKNKKEKAEKEDKLFKEAEENVATEIERFRKYLTAVEKG